MIPSLCVYHYITENRSRPKTLHCPTNAIHKLHKFVAIGGVRFHLVVIPISQCILQAFPSSAFGLTSGENYSGQINFVTVARAFAIAFSFRRWTSDSTSKMEKYNALSRNLKLSWCWKGRDEIETERRLLAIGFRYSLYKRNECAKIRRCASDWIIHETQAAIPMSSFLNFYILSHTVAANRHQNTAAAFRWPKI